MRMLPWPRSPARSGLDNSTRRKLRAGDVGDAVVPGELLVEEGLVGALEFHGVAVFPRLAEQEEVGFLG